MIRTLTPIGASFSAMALLSSGNPWRPGDIRWMPRQECRVPDGRALGGLGLRRQYEPDDSRSEADSMANFVAFSSRARSSTNGGRSVVFN